MQGGGKDYTQTQVNPPLCIFSNHHHASSQSPGPAGSAPASANASPVASQPTESWEIPTEGTQPSENRGSAPPRFSFGAYCREREATSPCVPHTAPALLPLTPAPAGGGNPFTPGTTPGEFAVPGLIGQATADVPPSMGAVEQGIRSFDELLAEAAASELSPDSAQEDGTPDRENQSAPAAPTPVAAKRRQKRSA